MSDEEEGQDQADLVDLFRRKREARRRDLANRGAPAPGTPQDEDALERSLKDKARDLKAFHQAPVEPAVTGPNPAPAEPPSPPPAPPVKELPLQKSPPNPLLDPAPPNLPPSAFPDAPGPTEAALVPVEPQMVVPAPVGPPSLSILSPALGLAARLGRDANITVRGHAVGRRIGLAMLVAGLAVLLVQARIRQAYGREYIFAPNALPVEFTFQALAAGLAVLGLLLYVAFCFIPGRRKLAIRIGATQKDEWRRVQREARIVRRLPAVGVALLLVGSAEALFLFLRGDPRTAALLSLVGLALAGIGIGLLVYAGARKTALHRLYVQTLVLANLEREGVGPAGGANDPKVASVILALDQLLGSLPESEVRAFLATKEAEEYLALIDKLRHSNGR